MKLAVLLSTYNGEKYLKEQVYSLENQTYKHFTLIARDDNSSDKSIHILKNFSVDILPSTINLGAKISFSKLLEYANESLNINYIMFADQDDVWNVDKIKKTYHKMQELESMHGKDIPLLVHSNLTVVDERLNLIASSFWKYQNINPSKQKLSDFIVGNNITGCTMMINRALIEKIKKIPDNAIMHDWWIAMVASVFGKIDYIDEPLMLYRQHLKNDTGAKKYGMQYFIREFFVKPSFKKYIQQSKAFLALYDQELDEYHKSMLEEFSSFDRLSKFQKLRVLFKYKIWKSGFMRNLGLIFFV